MASTPFGTLSVKPTAQSAEVTSKVNIYQLRLATGNAKTVIGEALATATLDWVSQLTLKRLGDRVEILIAKVNAPRSAHGSSSGWLTPREMEEIISLPQDRETLIKTSLPKEVRRVTRIMEDIFGEAGLSEAERREWRRSRL